MRRHHLALPLLILLVSPAMAQEQEAPTPSVSSLSDAEAIAMARDLVPQVEAIRGLKFKKQVPVKVVDDDAAREHFEACVRKLWPEEEISLEQETLVNLGLMPRGSDVLGLLLGVLEEQAGGYYDPDSGTLFLLGDMPASSAPILMVHELTHALDDQHFGIDTILETVRGESDRETAIDAVVEGSGVLVMQSFMSAEILAGRMSASVLMEIKESEAGRAERLRAAPQVLQRSLIGSYLLGQFFLLQGDPSTFLAGLRAQDLDRAFREPPLSSEQILHPAKYWDREKVDPPRDVRLPDLSSSLGAGWSLEGSDSLGELMLAILAGAPDVDLDSLDMLLGGWTNEAASGWGGDRWQLYVNGERSITVLGTLWDSARDAREFEEAVSGTLDRIWRRADAVLVIAGDVLDVSPAVTRRALNALVPETDSH